jgi:leucyl/phenylalanyl-tRNA---protein transferase
VISPSLLIEGYRRGLFPMGMPDGSVQWFSPDPRGIIPLDTFHVPKRLARAARTAGASGIDIRIDTAFVDVVRACAERPDGDGTWITSEILDSYESLFSLGFAHSVEVWQEGVLTGGLYGVAVGCAFFGESMFHRATDASKIALTALVDRLRARGFTLLDIQWVTPHLEQFGAIEIPRSEYLKRLATAVDGACSFV